MEEVPEAPLFKKPGLVRDFLTQFALYKPEQLDEITMRSFYQRQRLEYDFTPSSLATRKYQIQGFFKWLTFRGLITDSPQRKISMGRSKVYKRKHIWVRPVEIEFATAEARKRSPGMLYPMLLLINETAAKTHDIIELKWADIDFKNHRVIFHQEEKLQQRIIDVSEKWLNAVKQLDQMSEYVFTNLEGRQHYKHTLVRELRLFKRELGIEKDWVYRDIRHSFAINFLKAGGEIEYLQKVLGHHHVQMTKDLYGRYKTQTVDFFDSAAVPETRTSSSENADFE